jgi:hypothetical protein
MHKSSLADLSAKSFLVQCTRATHAFPDNTLHLLLQYRTWASVVVPFLR